VTPQLDVAHVALDNPSVGSADATFTDDVANVCRALDRIDGPVVLAGHSYGGAIITEAGMHDAVRHLVYICAFTLDVGESAMQNSLDPGGGLSEPLAAAMRFDEQGTVTVEREGAIAAFYNDCAADVADAAFARLLPQSMASFGGTVSAAAWREKPSTYVLCTRDAAATPVLQRTAAARAKDVIEIDAGHSPFLSRPAELAELLGRLAD